MYVLYVLDTDHCIELLRGNEGVLCKLESLGEDSEIEVYNLDLGAARIYGELKAQLARRGELLADNDLFIASIALSRRLTLVTHNTHHYERIPNLCLEDWME